MSEDSLAELGERLTGGDPSAVGEIFRVYGPYLRMVVRRRMTPRLRARFDSHDVVQSVWADTLLRAAARPGLASGRMFRDEARLRSFLVRLTVNRFIDFYRRHRPSMVRESRLSERDERALPARPGRPA